MATNPLVGAGYDKYVGTRSVAGQNQQEFYNLETGIGYQTPNDLLRAIQPYAGNQGNQMVDESNVFDVLAKGIAPSPNDVLNQAQKTALDAIKSTPASDPNLLREKANEVIGTTVTDFQKQIKDTQSKQDALLSQISGFFAQTESEKKLTGDLNNLDTSYEMGTNAISDKPIAMEFQTGQQASLDRGYQQKRNTLVRQLSSETTTRQQKIEAAKFLYDANRNALADTIQLMQNTAPDNIGSYTDSTGDMYVSMRNPITGEITKQLLGNTGTSEQQEAAKEFAMQYAISKPFYMIGQTIYNTATGQGYSTWEAYLAAGGSPDLKNVDTDITNTPVKFETKQIAGRYVHIGYNAAGEVVQQQDLGDANLPGDGKNNNDNPSPKPSPNPSPSPAPNSLVEKYGFNTFPKTPSANNIRTWLLGNWHKKAGNPYYDVWGQAADIMRENGVDPNKFDDVFWAVFRPGETKPEEKKGNIRKP